MNSRKHNQKLFGGALFGAGIVIAAAITTTATADFLPDDDPFDNLNQISLFAESTAGYVNLFDSSPDGFPAPQSYSGAGLDMSAYAGTEFIGASITLTDGATWNSDVEASVTQWFRVTTAKTVVLEWDLIDSTSFGRVHQHAFGYLAVVDGTTAGSISLDLSTGGVYSFHGFVTHRNGITGSSFIRISNVPAPGSVVLLSIGLMNTGRRRRRE